MYQLNTRLVLLADKRISLSYNEVFFNLLDEIILANWNASC